MLMQKWSKVCGLLLMSMLWACSSDESPTSINAGQNPSGQENIPLSQNNEVVLSSSSYSFNPGTPDVESSSAIAEKGKNEKFETTEIKSFYGSTTGDLYLQSEIKYFNYSIMSDSVETYDYSSITYNENGSEQMSTTAKSSQQGLKNITSGETKYYDYSTNTKIVSRVVVFETESSIDKDVKWTTYSSSKSTVVVGDEQTETSSVQTVTKEFVEESEKGRKYILHHVQDSQTFSTLVYVDDDGFVTEAYTYNSNGTLSNGFLYSRLPNAPESISKSAVCRSAIVDENSTYEYYNVSCVDAVNTTDEYKLIVKATYKYKSLDKEHYQETHYTFKKFEY